MKEIKFRIWDDKNKKLEYVDFYEPDWVFGKVPVMQYTGLKDKNGKEIYEGDILEYQDISGRKQIGDVRTPEYLFFYIHAKDGDDEGNQDGELHPDYQQDYEIIGNIYENPELLK